MSGAAFGMGLKNSSILAVSRDVFQEQLDVNGYLRI